MERDFAVEQLLGERAQVLAALGVRALDLGRGDVEHRLTARDGFFVRVRLRVGLSGAGAREEFVLRERLAVRLDERLEGLRK